MLPVKNVLLPTVSKLFDDDWNALFDWSNRNFESGFNSLPSVNIAETKDAFKVEMAAPGMKKEDFQIELNNNVLTIWSESKNEHTDNEVLYKVKEFSYTSFKRTFTLNKDVVNDDEIQASYENGVLSIVLPKREEAKEKPAKQIMIS